MYDPTVGIMFNLLSCTDCRYHETATAFFVSPLPVWIGEGRKSEYHTIYRYADTYFDMSNWGKGVVWINGHNLGRYWTTGPQQTVYVPAEWLKKGDNRVVIIELIKPEQSVLSSAEKPILDILK